MRIKHLDAREWEWLDRYDYVINYTNNSYLGYISIITIDKVKQKLLVDVNNQKKCICDNGYKGIIFLPDKENWCLTAMYDQTNSIVHLYFDIIRKKGINIEGIPFFEDLYLDVIVTNDLEIYTLDEDELEVAFSSGEIVIEDYDMAYKTRDKIVDIIINQREYINLLLENVLQDLINLENGLSILDIPNSKIKFMWDKENK